MGQRECQECNGKGMTLQDCPVCFDSQTGYYDTNVSCVCRGYSEFEQKCQVCEGEGHNVTSS